MDNDSGQGGVRDIPEHGREGVDGEKDNNSCDDTGERSSHASLGLNRCSGERSGSRVRSKEGTQAIANTDGDQLLGRINRVVVDTSERFGDRNVLNEEDDNGRRQFRNEGLDDGNRYIRDASVLETSRNGAQYRDQGLLPVVAVDEVTD